MHFIHTCLNLRETIATFKVKAMNAEGWGDYSYEMSDSTNKLPSKVAKPLSPLIEALSCNTGKVTVESPEGACFIAPVVLWQVIAIYFDCSACKDITKKHIKLCKRMFKFQFNRFGS